jgi:hypothetical protein
MFTVLAFIRHTWLVTPRQHRLGLEVQLLSVSFFRIKLLIVCKYNKRSDISSVGRPSFPLRWRCWVFICPSCELRRLRTQAMPKQVSLVYLNRAALATILSLFTHTTFDHLCRYR